MSRNFRLGQLIKFAFEDTNRCWVVDHDGRATINLVECVIEPGQIGMIVNKPLTRSFLVLFGENLVNMSAEFIKPT